MKKIKLTQGKYALVDDNDFEWLNQWKWHCVAGYAARAEYSLGKRKYIYMHRLIITAGGDEEVDHVNLGILDNRRKNLRAVNRSQNMSNTKLRATNTSGYKGISWDKHRHKWATEITVNYKKIHLGRFSNIKEAAEIYNRAALKYFGEFARLNKI